MANILQKQNSAYFLLRIIISILVSTSHICNQTPNSLPSAQIFVISVTLGLLCQVYTFIFVYSLHEPWRVILSTLLHSKYPLFFKFYAINSCLESHQSGRVQFSDRVQLFLKIFGNIQILRSETPIYFSKYFLFLSLIISPHLWLLSNIFK